MNPVYDRFGIQVWHGDCLNVMRGMEPESVHAVVTDPPAGIAFMNKSWDKDRGGRAQWVEWLTERMHQAYRVLKPGGHAIVWALPRTSHWTAWALEDAGFEIRDCVVHMFGTGFPKSLDVGKALDKRNGNAHLATKIAAVIRTARESRGWTIGQADRHFCNGSTNWTWFEGRDGDCRPPTPATFERIVAEWPELAEWAAIITEAEREVVGCDRRMNEPSGIVNVGQGPRTLIDRKITVPGTDAAKQWQGWGTALKPSQEIWWLCRKPMKSTVAANVLEHGTGALNIDASRVKSSDALVRPAIARNDNEVFGTGLGSGTQVEPGGRWPANVVFTHSPFCTESACDVSCAVAELDRQSGTTTSGSRKAGTYGLMGYMGADRATMPAVNGDSGSASRFFHCFRWEEKAPPNQRPMVNGVAHPTVKPVDLMVWLCRLVTPPGGTVLDPFCGTGTTLQAARACGFTAIGIDEDPDAITLTKARLDARPKTAAPAANAVPQEAPQDLFDLLGGVS